MCTHISYAKILLLLIPHYFVIRSPLFMFYCANTLSLKVGIWINKIWILHLLLSWRAVSCPKIMFNFKCFTYKKLSDKFENESLSILKFYVIILILWISNCECDIKSDNLLRKRNSVSGKSSQFVVSNRDFKDVNELYKNYKVNFTFSSVTLVMYRWVCKCLKCTDTCY